MDVVDSYSGLTQEQKVILKKIRAEQKEDPYSKTASSQKKEEPLDKLTDGKLEEVEKLKGKKFGDGTITNESIKERFITPDTGENLDPMHSGRQSKDNRSEGAREFMESLHKVEGEGGDEDVTNTNMTINGVKIPASMRRIIEETKRKQTSSQTPVKKVSDKKEDNGHNSGTLPDSDTDLIYEEQTYIGKPATKNGNRMTDLNKIQHTSVGDNINYYINGIPDNGIVVKMNGSYLTILKHDGKESIIHINDTFFVKDILTNKTWNDMSMEERTEQLQKIHAYSPRFLSKTWEQLPAELKDVLKKEGALPNPDLKDSESIHSGELSIKDRIAPSSFQRQSTIGTGKIPATFEGVGDGEKEAPKTGEAPDDTISKLKSILKGTKHRAVVSNSGGKSGGYDGNMEGLIHSDSNRPPPIIEKPIVTSQTKFFNEQGKQISESEYNDIYKSIINKLQRIKSDVEQGVYGNIGGLPNAGISTNTEIDAEKEYEGESHKDIKEQFKHEKKKPSTTADKKKENANADTGNGINSEGYYNPVFDKNHRIAGQGKDK